MEVLAFHEAGELCFPCLGYCGFTISPSALNTQRVQWAFLACAGPTLCLSTISPPLLPRILNLSHSFLSFQVLGASRGTCVECSCHMV